MVDASGVLQRFESFFSLFHQRTRKLIQRSSKQRWRALFAINKRQRFIIAVFLLTFGLFFSQHLFGKSAFFVAIFLSFASAFSFLLLDYKDIKNNYPLYVFVLPIFLYTLAVGFFYFLVPSRFLTRILVTTAYAVGLYSLFLSQNIFVVASLRTIPLLSGARIVSFAVTILSYFLLSTVVFSLRLPLHFTAPLVFAFSFLAVFQSIAVTFEKSLQKSLFWTLALSLSLFEISFLLWFWPSSPAVIALFLTGVFYITVGLSHVWFERRLFRTILWEYVWVGAIVFFILMLFTSWKT